jgi:hypothetical protein
MVFTRHCLCCREQHFRGTGSFCSNACRNAYVPPPVRQTAADRGRFPRHLRVKPAKVRVS